MVHPTSQPFHTRLWKQFRKVGWTGLILIGALPALADDAPVKIKLTPGMIINESGVGDATMLIDEQDLVGDPLNNKEAAGQPKGGWQTGWTKWRFPCSAIIDLGAKHKLTNIVLYDAEGVSSVAFAVGGPGKWKIVATDELDQYLAWTNHAVNDETRYLQVTCVNPGGAMPEIVLYGKATEKVDVPDVVAQTPPTIDQFIGSNAFIDDPLDLIAAGGFLREYHSWAWNDGDGKDAPVFPDNKLQFNPAAGGGGGWFFDQYYADLKAKGVTVAPCIQGGLKSLWDADAAYKSSYKPIKSGQSATDPASYAAHADFMFQYAARYGSTRVDDALLKLAPDQPRKSGLDLLTYLEDWNEQDKWWDGREGYFSPYEYAAMASADYDGHLGALGKTVGVKNADPKMKHVMGGVAKLGLDYLRCIKLWSDFNRDGSVPFDVINLHHYCNDGGGQQAGKVGVSPEADHLKERLAAIVDYRNRYLPGKEVWLTEFGYDTHPDSPQRAPKIGDKTQEDVQADWIVRSYLALAAAGVDRAAMYMLRDVNPNDGTQFSTSGLVGPKGEWKPKLSWFATSTLKQRLRDMRFDKELATRNEKVLAYAFKGEKNAGAIAVWCPTSDDSKAEGFHLSVGAATTAKLVTFGYGQPNGVEKALEIKDGEVVVDVSERPVLVMVN
jgi:hypothetical protein